MIFYAATEWFSEDQSPQSLVNSSENDLTILTGKSRVLLNPVQEFTEIEAWMLLTSFMYFYN